MFEKRKEIVIRSADKGGGVVILSKDFYHGQISETLADSEAYQKLDHDPTFEYRNQLNILVNKGFNTSVLSNKERAFLVTSNCRIPMIYTLPKIHKDPIHQQDLL